jgi:23S rRNA (guanosine2251-2'-O)-methyltransferase
MSFSIPKKAWHSFSRKQVLGSLGRIAVQIDQGWHKQDYRQAELENLKGYLENLIKTHPSEKIQNIAQKASEILFIENPTQVELQNFMMYLEREDHKDVKDEDFIISTEDTIEKKEQVIVPVSLVLDNLRSSFNVGSLFRTAESFGVQEIHLCGYTPTPENSKTARSSLGTENWIKWKYWESTFECLEYLKSKNQKIYAFETAESATDISTTKIDFPSAILLGNERYGISPEVLKFVDQTIMISMKGRKNSLNVGVCGAIGLHHFTSAYEPPSQ